MSQEYSFHLFRLNPFPSAEKEVIHPPKQRQFALPELAAIASGKPALFVDQRQHPAIAPVASGHAVGT